MRDRLTETQESQLYLLGARRKNAVVPGSKQERGTTAVPGHPVRTGMAVIGVCFVDCGRKVGENRADKRRFCPPLCGTEYTSWDSNPILSEVFCRAEISWSFGNKMFWKDRRKPYMFVRITKNLRQTVFALVCSGGVSAQGVWGISQLLSDRPHGWRPAPFRFRPDPAGGTGRWTCRFRSHILRAPPRWGS